MAWAVLFAGFGLILITGGWFYPIGIGLYAVSLTAAATWLANRANDGARHRWGLIAAAVVASLLLLLALTRLQYVVFFREAGRSATDAVGFWLFWPGSALLFGSLLLIPLARGHRLASFLRIATWVGAALFAGSLFLMQFGWIR